MGQFARLDLAAKRHLLYLNQYLKEGEKLKVGTNLANLRKGLPNFVVPYRLKNSVIKINGHLYLLAKHPKHQPIGKGGFGRVKFGRSLKRLTTVAIKIAKLQGGRASFEQKEAERLKDLGIGIADVVRIDQKKDYTVMEYLGTSLDVYLKTTTLSVEARLSLAIQLSILVDKLHRGMHAKSGKKITHRDLKPANITIDEDGKLHLIDFGISTDSPEEKQMQPVGSPGYLPVMERFVKEEKALYGWQLDMFALKRTLYFPNQVWMYGGYRRDSTRKNFNLPMILTQDILKTKGLGPLISTGGRAIRKEDRADDTLSPTALSAILIVALYSFGDAHYLKLKEDSALSMNVVSTYLSIHEERLRKAAIGKVLGITATKARSSQVKLHAVTPSRRAAPRPSSMRAQEKKRSSKSPFTTFLVKHDDNQRLKRAAVILNQQGLASAKNLEKLVNYPEFSAALDKLSFEVQRTSLPHVFNSELAFSAFRQLIKYDEPKLLPQVLNHKVALAILGKSKDKVLIKATLKLLKAGQLRHIHLLLLGNYTDRILNANNRAIEAADILFAVGQLKYLSKALSDSNHRWLKAVYNLLMMPEGRALKARILPRFGELFKHSQITSLLRTSLSEPCKWVCLYAFANRLVVNSQFQNLIYNKRAVSTLLGLFRREGIEAETCNCICRSASAFSVYRYLEGLEPTSALLNAVFQDAVTVNQVYRRLESRPSLHAIEEIARGHTVEAPKKSAYEPRFYGRAKAPFYENEALPGEQVQYAGYY